VKPAEAGVLAVRDVGGAEHHPRQGDERDEGEHDADDAYAPDGCLRVARLACDERRADVLLAGHGQAVRSRVR